MKNHLQSDCHNVRVLALEDFALTTKSERAFDDTTLVASKSIIEQSLIIQETVVSDILKTKISVYNDKYNHSLALTILSNILSDLSEDNTIAPFIQDRWYTSALMHLLINKIKLHRNTDTMQVLLLNMFLHYLQTLWKRALNLLRIRMH